MKCRQPLVQKYLCFGLSYFLLDILYMFRVHDSKRSNDTQKCDLWRRSKDFLRARPLIILHHLALPLIGFPLLLSYNGKLGDCLIGTGFLMEASTPFISFRAILANHGMKSSQIYLINGVLLCVVFFQCRILIFPHIYGLYAFELNKSIIETISENVPIICNASMLAIFIPQVYWFTMILKGAFKFIVKNKKV